MLTATDTGFSGEQTGRNHFETFPALSFPLKINNESMLKKKSKMPYQVSCTFRMVTNFSGNQELDSMVKHLMWKLIIIIQAEIFRS